MKINGINYGNTATLCRPLTLLAYATYRASAEIIQTGEHEGIAGLDYYNELDSSMPLARLNSTLDNSEQTSLPFIAMNFHYIVLSGIQTLTQNISSTASLTRCLDFGTLITLLARNTGNESLASHVDYHNPPCAISTQPTPNMLFNAEVWGLSTEDCASFADEYIWTAEYCSADPVYPDNNPTLLQYFFMLVLIAAAAYVYYQTVARDHYSDNAYLFDIESQRRPSRRPST